MYIHRRSDVNQIALKTIIKSVDSVEAKQVIFQIAISPWAKQFYFLCQRFDMLKIIQITSCIAPLLIGYAA